MIECRRGGLLVVLRQSVCVGEGNGGQENAIRSTMYTKTEEGFYYHNQQKTTTKEPRYPIHQYTGLPNYQDQIKKKRFPPYMQKHVLSSYTDTTTKE